MPYEEEEEPRRTHFGTPAAGYDEWMVRNPALAMGLAAAVPLRMLELRQMLPEHREHVIKRWAADAVDPIASHGDDLLFGSKKRGATADVFNHVARGLAALAHCPGGVTFAGQHFEAVPAAPEIRPPVYSVEVVDLLARITELQARPEEERHGPGADG